MKVGDLVKIKPPDNHPYHGIPSEQHGLVMQISTTGHSTTSAQVLFSDGEIWWAAGEHLEVIDESR
jgi:hypothetical protein